MSIPIERHAFLSDRHSSALVGPDGTIDWLCMPRFDSPTSCAALLDDEGGQWRIGPVDDARVERRYVGRTLVLETRFESERGVCTVTDALVLDRDDANDLGLSAPHVLVRVVRGVRGTCELDFECAPRPDYALTIPLVSKIDGGYSFRGGSDRYTLSGPLDAKLDTGVLSARLEVGEGDEVAFAFHWQQLESDAAPTLGQDEIVAMLDRTIRGWERWSATYEQWTGKGDELVDLSIRTLYGLSYAPTDAVVAAATTALPESPGEASNWDYRYAWLRDASFTLRAQRLAGSSVHSQRFFQFLAGAAGACRQGEMPMQIMFGVSGERYLPETRVEHLAGWDGNGPVLVGNGAWSQHQHDVYGELLDAALQLHDDEYPWDHDTCVLLQHCAERAAEIWHDPDHGMWELRGEPRHYVSSKVMCWVALDRACELARRGAIDGDVEHWEHAARTCRESVLERGFSRERGSFVLCYEEHALDASVLVIPIYGMLEADDERVLSTLDAIGSTLAEDGLLRRTESNPREGTFTACTFWFAQALALAGRVDASERAFARACACANELGLMSEQYDVQGGRQLGNFPQAYSHTGLVNSAVQIRAARERANSGEEAGHAPALGART